MPNILPIQLKIQIANATAQREFDLIVDFFMQNRASPRFQDILGQGGIKFSRKIDQVVFAGARILLSHSYLILPINPFLKNAIGESTINWAIYMLPHSADEELDVAAGTSAGASAGASADEDANFWNAQMTYISSERGERYELPLSPMGQLTAKQRRLHIERYRAEAASALVAPGSAAAAAAAAAPRPASPPPPRPASPHGIPGSAAAAAAAAAPRPASPPPPRPASPHGIPGSAAAAAAAAAPRPASPPPRPASPHGIPGSAAAAAAAAAPRPASPPPAGPPAPARPPSQPPRLPIWQNTDADPLIKYHFPQETSGLIGTGTGAKVKDLVLVATSLTLDEIRAVYKGLSLEDVVVKIMNAEDKENVQNEVAALKKLDQYVGRIKFNSKIYIVTKKIAGVQPGAVCANLDNVDQVLKFLIEILNAAIEFYAIFPQGHGDLKEENIFCDIADFENISVQFIDFETVGTTEGPGEHAADDMAAIASIFEDIIINQIPERFGDIPQIPQLNDLNSQIFEAQNQFRDIPDGQAKLSHFVSLLRRFILIFNDLRPRRSRKRGREEGAGGGGGGGGT